MSNIKNILILLVIAGIIFGGVYYYRQNYSGVSDTSTAVSVSKTSKVGQKTMALLSQVRSLNLDTAIFDDQAFIGLQQYSKVIPEQPVGRINPFAPFRRNGTETVRPATTTPATRR